MVNFCSGTTSFKLDTMPIPPEAVELANEANSVFVDEDYETALDLYTQVHDFGDCRLRAMYAPFLRMKVRCFS